MTHDISFLAFAHVYHVRDKTLAHVRDHVRLFYGNCQILRINVPFYFDTFHSLKPFK